jgi:hypothetical protein
MNSGAFVRALALTFSAVQSLAAALKRSGTSNLIGPRFVASACRQMQALKRESASSTVRMASS